MTTRLQDIYSITQVKTHLRKGGIFYTPDDLSEQLSKWLPQGFKYKSVYDPTCGRGSLLKPYEREGVALYGIDIEGNAVEDAGKTLKGFNGYVCDVLHDAPNVKYDLIVGNPPFSVKWSGTNTDPMVDALCPPCYPTQSRADYMFILHSLSRLNDNGCFYSILPVGVLYRLQREKTLRKWLVDEGYIRRVVRVPEGLFEDTQIETVVVFFEKGKKADFVYFNELNSDKEEAVSIKEIAENDYNLTPLLYLKQEDKDHGPLMPPNADEFITYSVKTISLTMDILRVIDEFTQGSDYLKAYKEEIKRLLI